MTIATCPSLQPGGVGIWRRLSWQLGSYSWLMGSNYSISYFLRMSLTTSLLWIMRSMYLSLCSDCSANFLQLAMQSATSSNSLAILVTAKLLLQSTYLLQQQCTFLLFWWRVRVPTRTSQYCPQFCAPSLLSPSTTSCRIQCSSRRAPLSLTVPLASSIPARISCERISMILTSIALLALRNSICSTSRQGGPHGDHDGRGRGCILGRVDDGSVGGIHGDGRGRVCSLGRANDVPILDCGVYAFLNESPLCRVSFHGVLSHASSHGDGLPCRVFRVCVIGRRQRVVDGESWRGV